MGYNSILDFVRLYGFKNAAETKFNSNELKFINQHSHILSKIVDTILEKQNVTKKSAIVQPDKIDISQTKHEPELYNLVNEEIQIPKNLIEKPNEIGLYLFNGKKLLKQKINIKIKPEIEPKTEKLDITKSYDFNTWVNGKTENTENNIAKQKRNTTKTPIIDGNKTCNTCKISKPLDDFYKVNKGKSYDGKCKKCRYQYLKDYKNAN